MPLTPNDVGAAPAPIDATHAAPKPKTPAELEGSVQADSQQLDQHLADANMTEEQLAESNEPAFIGALDAKKTAQTSAVETPPAYRASEQGMLTQAQRDAETLEQTQTQAMVSERTDLFGQVDGLQTDTKTTDEAKRRAIGAQITTIYEQTKTDVENRLKQLDAEVDAAFEQGAATAKAAFTSYVDRETKAYKAERYNEDAGWLDNPLEKLGGEALRVWDNATRMPQEYLDIYDTGRDAYIAAMDIVLDQIADIVATGLSEARQRVSAGRQEIEAYVAGQPEALREIAQQAASDIQGKFDQLEQQIAAKETALIDSLAQRYSEHLQALDAEIAAAKEACKGFFQKAWDATAGVVQQILELKDLLMGVLARAANAITTMLANPMQFVGNLIDGIGQGLTQFLHNIGTHLQTGFVEWLTGTLGGAGIQLPDHFDLPGIFDLAMQVLGLTYANIRSRAVGIFGETVVAALETGFEIFHILVTEGLAGLWQWVQDQLGNLKDMLFEAIQEMLIGEVIEAGIKWLIGLLGGPAGAFIKACMMIYDIVMWFINNAGRLMALVDSVLDSIEAIAAGNLTNAANAVENALGQALPVAIGFLASLLGLGDLSQKIRKVIDKVQEPINTAIDYVLNLVKSFVQKVAKMLGFGGDGAGGADGAIGKEVTFAAGEESHKLWVDEQGSGATLMVASKPMTVAEQLAAWEGKVATLPDAAQGQAQALLGQARSLMTAADQDADLLARKKQEVKTLDDGDTLAASQTSLEATEDTLAGVLQQLFELFEAVEGPLWEDVRSRQQAAHALLNSVSEQLNEYGQLKNEYQEQLDRLETNIPGTAGSRGFSDEENEEHMQWQRNVLEQAQNELSRFDTENNGHHTEFNRLQSDLNTTDDLFKETNTQTAPAELLSFYSEVHNQLLQLVLQRGIVMVS